MANDEIEGNLTKLRAFSGYYPFLQLGCQM